MTKQKIANRYQVGEQVKEQKLYMVYQALDTKENKPVSISILSTAAQQKPLEILLRYRKIKENLLKVKHANLQQLLEVGEEAPPISSDGQESRDYTVYEAAGSQTLKDFHPADAEAGIRIIQGIVLGLSAAHEAKILHGAINPANILIQEQIGVSSSELVVKDKETQELPTTNYQLLSSNFTPKLTRFGLNLLLDLTKVNTLAEIREVFGYLSPEGTGILRKPIDERSDLYSVGVLFYELLTSRLPYESTAVSELIHQHIAQSPIPPSKINPEIPPVIEKIVLRLLAKDPTDRYQSASGLIYDLEEYQRRVVEANEAQRHRGTEAQSKDSVIPEVVIGNPVLDLRLIDFEIARQDRLKELNFSSKLIGRERELREITSYLEQSARQGQGKVCLIHGEPGVGKSRLVDELRSAVHSHHGLFAGGKCEQYAFAVPYHVIIEALEVYIDKVKRQSQDEQARQILRLKEVLGQLGGEVVKLTLRIKELIGEPEALVALDSPEKEKIRFLITVSEFMANLGSQENPLLLFLDDLQWVDEGSVEILERVLPKTQEKPLTLIISYRSTEVDENHILARMLKKIADSDNELELMKAFSVQASVSIENTRLVGNMVEQERLKQEMELGRDIQMNLLPKEAPYVEGLKLIGLMVPAKEIGGDYYDYIVTSGKSSDTVVSGKVVKEKQENDTPVPLYPAQQTVAGRHSTTGSVEVIQSGGFMLGMLPEIGEMLEDCSIQLNTGDKVILYTDGVTEAHDPQGDLYSLERLTAAVQRHGHKPVEELLEAVRQDVYSFISTQAQYDDITLVGMESI